MLLDSKGQHKDERSLINSQLSSGEEADFEEVDYDLFWK